MFGVIRSYLLTKFFNIDLPVCTNPIEKGHLHEFLQSLRRQLLALSGKGRF